MDDGAVLEALKALCAGHPMTARRITNLADGSPAVIFNDESRTQGKAVIMVAAVGASAPVGVIADVKRIGPRYVLADGSDRTVHFKGWLFAVARELSTPVEQAEGE